MRRLPDWEAFRDYIAEDLEDKDLITVDGLNMAYSEYQIEEMNIELSRIVDKNFSKFIDEIRSAGVDEAITRCYEITVKSNIQSYIESEPADLSKEQFEALISSDSPLDEIYSAWLKREYLKTYDDIPKAMEYAADVILESKNRGKNKTVNMTVKPTKKGGAR